jgi:hypothetical protein
MSRCPQVPMSPSPTLSQKVWTMHMCHGWHMLKHVDLQGIPNTGEMEMIFLWWSWSPVGEENCVLILLILFGNLWKLEILFPRFALSSLSSAPTLDLHRRGSLSYSAREAAASRIESKHYATQLNTAERWWRHCRTVLNTQTPIIAFIMLSFQVLVCNMFVMPGTCVCFSAFRFQFVEFVRDF